jgi:hypothetical protein
MSIRPYKMAIMLEDEQTYTNSALHKPTCHTETL